MIRRLWRLRERFWARWAFLSIAHFVLSAGILYLVELGDLPWHLWLTDDARLFVQPALLNAYFWHNLPVWTGVERGLFTSLPKNLVYPSAFALTFLDSIFYGFALAGAFHLARGDLQTRGHDWGFPARIVGRGLLVAIGYVAVSWFLAMMLLADSDGLLTSDFTGQDEIVFLLTVMHPLATFSELEIDVAISHSMNYTLVIMADSVAISVLGTWCWAVLARRVRGRQGVRGKAAA